MHILSRVCADFHDEAGNTLFSITPKMLNIPGIEAPDSIQQDPLFGMLLHDGSLEVIITAERRRALEQDPLAGYDAAGKAIRPDPDPEKPGKSGKASKAKAADAVTEPEPEKAAK